MDSLQRRHLHWSPFDCGLDTCEQAAEAWPMPSEFFVTIQVLRFMQHADSKVLAPARCGGARAQPKRVRRGSIRVVSLPRAPRPPAVSYFPFAVSLVRQVFQTRQMSYAATIPGITTAELSACRSTATEGLCLCREDRARHERIA